MPLNKEIKRILLEESISVHFPKSSELESPPLIPCSVIFITHPVFEVKDKSYLQSLKRIFLRYTWCLINLIGITKTSFPFVFSFINRNVFISDLSQMNACFDRMLVHNCHNFSNIKFVSFLKQKRKRFLIEYIFILFSKRRKIGKTKK